MLFFLHSSHLVSISTGRTFIFLKTSMVEQRRGQSEERFCFIIYSSQDPELTRLISTLTGNMALLQESRFTVNEIKVGQNSREYR